MRMTGAIKVCVFHTFIDYMAFFSAKFRLRLKDFSRWPVYDCFGDLPPGQMRILGSNWTVEPAGELEQGKMAERRHGMRGKGCPDKVLRPVVGPGAGISLEVC